MDTYADDLAALIEALDLQGRDPRRPLDRRRRGGPLHRPPRHQAGRQGGADRRGAAADAQDRRPIPAACRSRSSTASAPASLADRSQFFKDLSAPFYGANRPGAKVSQGVRDSFWLQGMQAGLKGALDCIKAFSETDFTEDLKKFDVPTLIIHGDDDQIVPIEISGELSAKLVKGSTLKVYPGAPHGLAQLAGKFKDDFNADLLASSRHERGRADRSAPAQRGDESSVGRSTHRPSPHEVCDKATGGGPTTVFR